MPSLRVRPAAAEDAPKVAEIWEEGWRAGHLGHVPEELTRIRTPESFRSRAADRVGDTTVATAENGDVVGFVMVVGDEVEQVYVAREHRGSGVAVTLLDEAGRLVAANGYTKAWLAAAVGNARARRFYEREGWADEGYFDYVATHSGGTIAIPCHRYTKSVFVV